MLTPICWGPTRPAPRLTPPAPHPSPVTAGQEVGGGGVGLVEMDIW